LIVSCLLRGRLTMNSIRSVFHVRNLLTLPLSPVGEREGVRGMKMLRRNLNLVSETF
jgi:hypothetical protein